MASSCGWAATSAAAASRRRRASPRPGARSAPATTRRSRAASTTGTSPSTARSRLEKEEWPPSAPSVPVTSSAVLPETVDTARPPTDATSAASSSFRSGRARKPMKTTARPSPAENGPAAASDDDRGDGAFGGRGRFAAADGRAASAGRLSRAASARRASASRARRRRSSFSTQPAHPRPARAISALRSLTLISSTRLAPLAGGASSSDDAARSMTGDALRGRGLVPAVFRSSTAGALRSSLSSSSDDESSRPFLRAAAGGAAAGASSSSSELESSKAIPRSPSSESTLTR